MDDYAGYIEELDYDAASETISNLRRLDLAFLYEFRAAIASEIDSREQDYERGQILAAYDHARAHSEELDTITLWRNLRSGLDVMGYDHPRTLATSLVVRLRFGLI